MKLLSVEYAGALLRLYRLRGDTFKETYLSKVKVSNTFKESDERMIAFTPRFTDFDGSNLGTAFLYLKHVFPCIEDYINSSHPDVRPSKMIPRCSIHTYDEGGFNKGKPVLAISDSGDHIKELDDPQSNENPTFAFAVNECDTFSKGNEDGCLHRGYKFTIVCYVPRKFCPSDEELV